MAPGRRSIATGPPASAAPPRAAPDVYLRDEIAESLAKHAERLPEARELLAALDGRGPEAARPPSPGAATSRLAVRGLTGSARGFLASWLQRATGRTVLYLVVHGDGFEEARDDVEYFRGAAQTLAFPEPDDLPYDPSPPHTDFTTPRLETLSRQAHAEP